MLDMEDQEVTDATLALHNDIRTAGLPVAVTLQAYLKRSVNDMNSLIASGATVRLVKGAFAAGADVAYTTRREVKSNSRKVIGGVACATQLLRNKQSQGCRLQTHHCDA